MDFPGCIVEQYDDRESWLEGRRRCIGASDTAAILGEGYADQCPETVWESKVREAPEVSEATRRRFNVAKRLEPAFRSIFTDETGLPVANPGDFTILRHRDYPWLGATLDGAGEDDDGRFILELKDVSHHQKHDWDDGQLPLKFQIQVQQQMFVADIPRAYVMGVCNREPMIRRVELAPEFVEATLPHLREFWGYVERGELPPISASKAAYRVIARLYPKDDGTTAVLPADLVQWAAKLQVAKAIKSEAKEIEEAAKSMLTDAIGNSTFGELPHVDDAGDLLAKTKQEILIKMAEKEVELPVKFSWKWQSTKGYYVTPKESRVLRGHSK
jgi:putative phage-type endonuclease